DAEQLVVGKSKKMFVIELADKAQPKRLGVKSYGPLKVGCFQNHMTERDVAEGETIHANFEMIVVEICEAKGADEWRCFRMLARLGANHSGFLDPFHGGLESRFGPESDRIARRGAGGSVGLDAGQIEADDVLAGFDIGMARRAVGVFTLRQESQADSFDVEFFRARQIAHRKSHMIECFGAKHFFLPRAKLLKQVFLPCPSRELPINLPAVPAFVSKRFRRGSGCLPCRTSGSARAY